jgi:hypothetical protein
MKISDPWRTFIYLKSIEKLGSKALNIAEIMKTQWRWVLPLISLREA